METKVRKIRKKKCNVCGNRNSDITKCPNWWKIKYCCMDCFKYLQEHVKCCKICLPLCNSCLHGNGIGLLEDEGLVCFSRGFREMQR